MAEKIEIASSQATAAAGAEAASSILSQKELVKEKIRQEQAKMKVTQAEGEY